MHACAWWPHCHLHVSWGFLGGQLWWLGDCCLCADGLLGVHVMRCLGSFLFGIRFFVCFFLGMGEALWGRVGVMGCLW